MPATLVVASVMLSTTFVVRGIELLRRGPAISASTDWTPKPVAPPPSEGGGVGAGTRILARNMFDSATGPQPWQAATPPAADTETDSPIDLSGPIGPCQGDLRLQACVVNDRHPEQSFASLRVGQESHLVRVGDGFADMTLLALRPALAYVRQPDGRPCELAVFSPAGQGPGAPPPPAPSSTAPTSNKGTPSGMFSDAELDQGIRSLGGDRFVVSRAMVEQALKNPRKVAQGGRMRPYTRNGKSVGLRAVRIRKGTVLDRLGLKNGDVVRKINGFDLASPDGMLSAVALLKQRDTFTLAIERGGKPQDLQFRLE